MQYPRHVLTERLALTATDTATDVDGLFGLLSAPSQWEHAPESRHLVRETSADWVARSAARWETDGLSYWTVRSRVDAKIIGVGGAQRQSTGAWNLLWRIAAGHRGRGLAVELGQAAIEAAHATDPSVPVLAWILPHNLASIGVASRLGLVDRGPLPDPSDGVVRVAYSDRPLRETT